MRKFIIVPAILGCLLGTPVADGFSQTSNRDIEEVYRKQDTRSWGDIFRWFFDKKESFGKSYALVIGIGDYQKGWPTLEAPYYDAIRVRDFLINDAGFDYVVTVTNGKATKQKINKLMEEDFPHLLGENDRFLFYFSGHGTQRFRGDVPFGYIVLQNSGSESYGDMITMDDIGRWDNLLNPTRHVLFILDSCFSGLAGQQRKSGLTDKKLARLSQYSHHLITAGTANEKSVASLRKWHGSLFTDSFIRAVSGRADLTSRDFEADGIVSLKEVMKYIGDRIDDESAKLKTRNPLSKGIKMSPQISDLQENEGEFFFITREIKNRKVQNPLSEELAHGWPEGIKGKGRVSIGLEPPTEIEIQLPESIFHDRRTGLMWTREDNGEEIPWQDANRYCENLALGNYSWRLPTFDELAELYDPNSNAKYKIRNPFQLTGCCPWTSTKAPDPSMYPLLEPVIDWGWSFDFYGGRRVKTPHTDPEYGRALCVRRSGE